ncbi:MAG: recombinase family protein [Desulfovibrionaceae bacterium]
MAIFGYVRCSTDEQAQAGNGLHAQKDAIAAWAAKQGEPVAAFFEDAGISGAKPLSARPALLELLSSLKKGDTVAVMKLDRVARDVLVSAMTEAAIQRKGARLISTSGEGTEDDSPAGLLMRRLVSSFAEYERAIISSRTKSALQAKKRRNERTGSVPYGKSLADDGVHLIDNHEEQDVIARAREYHAAGLSLRGIAARLASQGLYARNGRPFYAEQVRAMLREEAA